MVRKSKELKLLKRNKKGKVINKKAQLEFAIMKGLVLAFAVAVAFLIAEIILG